MATTTYQADLQAALQQEKERLDAELGDNRPKMGKSAPLTGNLAKLSDRIMFLQELQESMQEDPELLRFVDNVIGQQVQATERRQTRLTVILSVVSLVAGWLLSLIGTPANIAHLMGR
jgi:hypothetical protein